MGALNNVDQNTGDGKLSMSFCDSFSWSDLDGGVEQVSRKQLRPDNHCLHMACRVFLKL